MLAAGPQMANYQKLRPLKGFSSECVSFPYTHQEFSWAQLVHVLHPSNSVHQLFIFPQLYTCFNCSEMNQLSVGTIQVFLTGFVLLFGTDNKRYEQQLIKQNNEATVLCTKTALIFTPTHNKGMFYTSICFVLKDVPNDQT